MVRSATPPQAVTLSQAKELVRCLADSESLLLLSPPGVGKSEAVNQAAREAGLEVRSLLGTQIAPEDVSGVPKLVRDRAVFCPPRLLAPRRRQAVLPVPRRTPSRAAGGAKGVLLTAAGTPCRRVPLAEGNLGGRGRQPQRGPGTGSHHVQRAFEPRVRGAGEGRSGRVAGVGPERRGASRHPRLRPLHPPVAAAAGAARPGAVLHTPRLGDALAQIWTLPRRPRR